MRKEKMLVKKKKKRIYQKLSGSRPDPDSAMHPSPRLTVLEKSQGWIESEVIYHYPSLDLSCHITKWGGNVV